MTYESVEMTYESVEMTYESVEMTYESVEITNRVIDTKSDCLWLGSQPQTFTLVTAIQYTAPPGFIVQVPGDCLANA